MSFQQLRSTYEKRRMMLIDTLRKGNKLDKSRKDQINGAIAEIDALLKTIDNLRDQEIQDNENLDAKNKYVENLGVLGNINILKNISDRFKVKFEESQTKRNLMNIFMKKCDTRTRYEFYSNIAKHDGYENIAQVFQDFSEHEKEHIRILFKFLDLDKSTFQNLKDAAMIEQQYHTKMYSDIEDTARKENFSEIADFLKDLAQIEAEQEKRFLKLLKIFHEKKIFSSDHVIKWRCRNCGNVTEGKNAPGKCKLCKKPQSYFEELKE